MQRIAFPIVIGLFFSWTGNATLGKKLDSVGTGMGSVFVKHALTENRGQFLKHEVTNDGMTLHEFTNSQGIVFAIAWQGNNQPDLAPFLGDYLSEYRNALAQPTELPSKTARTRMLLPRVAQRQWQTENLVIMKFGHLRAMGGKAYLPKLLPPGVSIHDIK